MLLPVGGGGYWLYKNVQKVEHLIFFSFSYIIIMLKK